MSLHIQSVDVWFLLCVIPLSGSGVRKLHQLESISFAYTFCKELLSGIYL